MVPPTLSVDDITSGYGSINNYQPLLSNYKSQQAYQGGETSDFLNNNNNLIQIDN